MPTTLTTRPAGHLSEGREVFTHTLDNGRGLVLEAMDLGGIVTALRVPDRHGQTGNVVLGLPTLADYETRNPHFGVIVGRYANRIAGSRFEIDGQVHTLVANEGPHCLHGGPRGFGTQLWQGTAEPDGHGGQQLCLRRVSEAGEQGFPGQLVAEVRYRLDDAMGWHIDYQAWCDAPTVINLSHHDYFNLAGHGTAMGHELQLPASHYAEVDAALIPTGLAPVAGTPFDFRQPTPIEARLRSPHAQLARARGYDHSWQLDAAFDGQLHPAARLRDPASGRIMEVLTTEPAVQFYSGNFLDGSLAGSGGQLYRQGDGLCLETQHHPDSPNQAAQQGWPSTVLRPGKRFHSHTLHRFSHDG